MACGYMPKQTIISDFESGEPQHHHHNATNVASMVGAGGLNLAAGGPPPPPTASSLKSAPSKCATCCRFLRQVISFLLSHIGLLSLVVGYCIMGAFVFEMLEHENELKVKKNMTENRHRVTEQLWDITR